MNHVNAIDAKKTSSSFTNEAKKTKKNINFYHYSKLIDIFKRATFVARFY